METKILRFKSKEQNFCDREMKQIKEGFLIPSVIMGEAIIKGFNNNDGLAGRMIGGEKVFSLCDECFKEFHDFAPDHAFAGPSQEKVNQ